MDDAGDLAFSSYQQDTDLLFGDEDIEPTRDGFPTPEPDVDVAYRAKKFDPTQLPKDYKSYKIAIAAPKKKQFFVCKFSSGKSVDLKDSAQPITIGRPRLANDEDDDDEVVETKPAPQPGAAPAAEPPKRRPGQRKKPLVVTHITDEERARRVRSVDKSAPIILEDSDGENVFEGRWSKVQAAKYVVMYMKPDQTLAMHPVSDWYEFKQKVALNTMSLEDAEAAMLEYQKKGSSAFKKWEERATGIVKAKSEKSEDDDVKSRKKEKEEGDDDLSGFDDDVLARPVGYDQDELNARAMLAADDDIKTEKPEDQGKKTPVVTATKPAPTMPSQTAPARPVKREMMGDEDAAMKRIRTGDSYVKRDELIDVIRTRQPISNTDLIKVFQKRGFVSTKDQQDHFKQVLQNVACRSDGLWILKEHV